VKIDCRRKFRVYCQEFNEVVTVAQTILCSFHKIQKIAKKGLKSGNYGGIMSVTA
jgi:hypothetical protein